MQLVKWQENACVDTFARAGARVFHRVYLVYMRLLRKKNNTNQRQKKKMCRPIVSLVFCKEACISCTFVSFSCNFLFANAMRADLC